MKLSFLYSSLPTPGIFLTERGARNAFSVPLSTFLVPLGFDSPVPTLDTSLFTDKPKEMGKPVSLITFCRCYSAHL